MGVDNTAGVEYITNDNAILEETEKLIQVQEVVTVISMRANFANAEQDAIGALDIVS